MHSVLTAMNFETPVVACTLRPERRIIFDRALSRVRFHEAVKAPPMTGIGAFAPAQDRAECRLPGEANPPNKDRHGSKAEIQAETPPKSDVRH